MLETEAHVGIRGEVEDKIATGHRFGERGQIQVVTLDEFEIFIFQRGVQKFPLAGGKIIPADHGFAVGEQAVNEIAADETRRAGDENLLLDRKWSLKQAGKARQHIQICRRWPFHPCNVCR
jgi:hypothetical protein